MRHKIRKSVSCLVLIICVIVIYLVSTGFPTQKLKILATTTAETFDIAGETDLRYFHHMSVGKSYKADITFIAVPSTSKNLFTHFGKGQSVYLGCNELHAECGFISFGKVLTVTLKLKANQEDLKLEDGTPFDITRYSLKPVLTIKAVGS